MTGFYTKEKLSSDLQQLGLAVDEPVTLADVKRQRHRLLQVSHPDMGGRTVVAQDINLAYARLYTHLRRQAEREIILKRVRRGMSVAMVAGAGVLLALRRYRPR